MPRPLARQSTHVGKGRRKRRPARRKIAYYRKGKKRLNVRRGNPIRETKTRSGEEVWDDFLTSVQGTAGIDHPNTLAGSNGGQLPFWPTNHTAGIGGLIRVIPLYSITCQQRGMTDERMVGSSAFVKYMKLKGRITWGPQSQVFTACDLRVIHGFIKNSPNLNGRQSFRAVNPQPEDEWSVLKQIQFTYDELQPYFDSLEDDLTFRPKRESNLMVLGNRKLTPSLKQWTARVHSTDASGPVNTSVGTYPDTRFSCNWPMMRKYHYETGLNQFKNPMTGGDPGATQVAPQMALQYINTAQWTPFCCLWAPQGTTLLPTTTGELGSLPGFQYNDQIWYQDS